MLLEMEAKAVFGSLECLKEINSQSMRNSATEKN